MRSRVVGSIDVAGGTTSALTSVFADAVVATEFHDMTANNINASGGAFVAFGSGAALPATIRNVQLSYTAGEPLAFRVAASAGAAAALSLDSFVLNQGDGPVVIPTSIASGSKLWVRSKSLNAVAAGYITANFGG